MSADSCWIARVVAQRPRSRPLPRIVQALRAQTARPHPRTRRRLVHGPYDQRVDERARRQQDGRDDAREQLWGACGLGGDARCGGRWRADAAVNCPSSRLLSMLSNFAHTLLPLVPVFALRSVQTPYSLSPRSCSPRPQRSPTYPDSATRRYAACAKRSRLRSRCRRGTRSAKSPSAKLRNEARAASGS